MKLPENTTAGKDAVTIISEGVVIEGKLSSKGNVRIDGTINGNLQVSGNITVGKSGLVNGEVAGQMIIHGGKIEGTIKANEKVVLEGTSILKGDIFTKILVVEEGAIFDGNSSMSSKEKTNLFNPPSAPPPPKDMK